MTEVAWEEKDGGCWWFAMLGRWKMRVVRMHTHQGEGRPDHLSYAWWAWIPGEHLMELGLTKDLQLAKLRALDAVVHAGNREKR